MENIRESFREMETGKECDRCYCQAADMLRIVELGSLMKWGEAMLPEARTEYLF